MRSWRRWLAGSGELIATELRTGVPRQDPEIPRIFVNGKVISRWNIPNQFIVERVIPGKRWDKEAKKAQGVAPHY